MAIIFPMETKGFGRRFFRGRENRSRGIVNADGYQNRTQVPVALIAAVPGCSAGFRCYSAPVLCRSDGRNEISVARSAARAVQPHGADQFVR